jgi:hypothetical protein
MRKIEFNKTQDKEVKVSCGGCRSKTWHKVILSVDESGTDERGGGEWTAHYQTIQCQGCKALSFRQVGTNPDDFRQVSLGKWEASETETVFPSRTAGRIPLRDANVLPDQLRTIYVETIASLNNRQPLLSGIGVRAILETICRDRKAEGKDLHQKLRFLVTDGVLTRQGAEILQLLRNLGNNDAPQDIVAHSAEELTLAMDVIEHLLQGSYVLPYYARKAMANQQPGGNSHQQPNYQRAAAAGAR